LSYLNARYYDGARGQFLSEDPVFLDDPNKQKLTDPQSLNTYAYTEDNPVTKSDPSGRAVGWDDAAGFVAGGVVGAVMYSGESAVTGQWKWSGLAESFVSGGIVGVGAVNAPETGGMSISAALAARAGVAAAFGGLGCEFRRSRTPIPI
jgi:RHS repeat-associated protein